MKYISLILFWVIVGKLLIVLYAKMKYSWMLIKWINYAMANPGNNFSELTSYDRPDEFHTWVRNVSGAFDLRSSIRWKNAVHKYSTRWKQKRNKIIVWICIAGNFRHHSNGRRSEAWFWRDSFRDHNKGMIALIRKFHTWARSVVCGGGLEGICYSSEVIMKLIQRICDQVNTLVA